MCTSEGGIVVLYCASASASSQLLTQVTPLKASGSYMGGKSKRIPTQLKVGGPAPATLVLLSQLGFPVSAPAHINIMVGQ